MALYETSVANDMDGGPLVYEECPFELFDQWMRMAEASEPADPNAMALATSGPDGAANVRMVLLKGFGPDGFVFYTNSESRKGRELAANMRAAGVLHWKSLQRQVRFQGPVSPVSSEEADVYFASRPRDSRIGAWASQQSRQLERRDILLEAVQRAAEMFVGGEVPRPPHWNGYCIQPTYIEFWTAKPYRLHDRLVYTRPEPGSRWSRTVLYP